MLQHQIIVLQSPTDLDIAEHYYLEIGDGKAVGQGHLARELKSPELVQRLVCGRSLLRSTFLQGSSWADSRWVKNGESSYW
jgi:hypothetical protein